MNGISPFREIRRNIVFEYLEKYPGASTHMIARMIIRDNPLFFPKGHEEARSMVRNYRGVNGIKNRKAYKITKYYRNV